jgi:Domain of unknown function (DUF4440)
MSRLRQLKEAQECEKGSEHTRAGRSVSRKRFANLVEQHHASNQESHGRRAKATKQEFLDNVKSGVSKLESFEFGPMDVKVIGTIAIVQGSDTEKSSYKGKDTSGKWAWMDVFAMRDGKWQAVRSQSAMVVK